MIQGMIEHCYGLDTTCGHGGYVARPFGYTNAWQVQSVASPDLPHALTNPRQQIWDSACSLHHSVSLQNPSVAASMSSLPAPESRPANLPSSRSLAAARRAGKACQNCRLRKVKCDALLHGIPCRNCRNDDAQCIMGGCRRGRKRRTWYSNVKDDVAASRSDVADNAAVVEPNAQSTPPRTFPERHGTTEKPSTDNTTVLNSVMSLGDIPATLQLLGPYNAPFTPPPEQYNFPEQYLKFRPILQTLSQDDFEYVQSKKATELPPNPLRDEIVRCYIDHVHPYMPLLDAYELLRLIGPSVRRSTKTQYSILLFQCVMFAAIAFVDERLIQDAGYPNAQAARKAFYLKTRVCIPHLNRLAKAHYHRSYTIWMSRPTISLLFSASY